MSSNYVQTYAVKMCDTYGSCGSSVRDDLDCEHLADCLQIPRYGKQEALHFLGKGKGVSRVLRAKFCFVNCSCAAILGGGRIGANVPVILCRAHANTRAQAFRVAKPSATTEKVSE